MVEVVVYCPADCDTPTHHVMQLVSPNALVCTRRLPSNNARCGRYRLARVAQRRYSNASIHYTRHRVSCLHSPTLRPNSEYIRHRRPCVATRIPVKVGRVHCVASLTVAPGKGRRSDDRNEENKSCDGRLRIAYTVVLEQPKMMQPVEDVFLPPHCKSP